MVRTRRAVATLGLLLLPIVAVGCVPLGGACAGVVSMFLVARYGWPILFEIGGTHTPVFLVDLAFTDVGAICESAIDRAKGPDIATGFFTILGHEFFRAIAFFIQKFDQRLDSL